MCFCDSYLYFCDVFGSMKCMPKYIHFNVSLKWRKEMKRKEKV